MSFSRSSIFCALLSVAGLAGSTSAVAAQEGVVLPASLVEYQQVAPFVKMGPAWGNRMSGAHGTFGAFPGGAASPWHTHSGAYHAVVISGTMTNPFRGETDPPEIAAGSYWFVPAGEVHQTSCVSTEPCVFYFHAEVAFDFTVAE